MALTWLYDLWLSGVDLLFAAHSPSCAVVLFSLRDTVGGYLDDLSSVAVSALAAGTATSVAGILLTVSSTHAKRLFNTWLAPLYWSGCAHPATDHY